MISIEILRRFPLFVGLDKYFRDLAMEGEEITLKTDEWLFHEGDAADFIYLILSGSIELKMAHDSERIHHAHLSTLSVEGDTIGWSALVVPHLYSFCAIAAKDTRLVKFNAAYIRDLMEEDREAGCILMYRLAQIMRTRMKNMHIRFASLVGP
ncbi:MAG: cyclic nucleotide-binding domain-containing protein [Anaerolineae bacterium]|jgi:CRP-like cAMP-binding protein|nr:cyclic nucleotide-binding domain-containing protein [Anaerolineae bacterium]